MMYWNKRAEELYRDLQKIPDIEVYNYEYGEERNRIEIVTVVYKGCMLLHILYRVSNGLIYELRKLKNYELKNRKIVSKLSYKKEIEVLDSEQTVIYKCLEECSKNIKEYKKFKNKLRINEIGKDFE